MPTALWPKKILILLIPYLSFYKTYKLELGAESLSGERQTFSERWSSPGSSPQPLCNLEITV